jgi:hypothetical protein
MSFTPTDITEVSKTNRYGEGNNNCNQFFSAFARAANLCPDITHAYEVETADMRFYGLSISDPEYKPPPISLIAQEVPVAIKFDDREIQEVEGLKEKQIMLQILNDDRNSTINDNKNKFKIQANYNKIACDLLTPTMQQATVSNKAFKSLPYLWMSEIYRLHKLHGTNNESSTTWSQWFSLSQQPNESFPSLLYRFNNLKDALGAYDGCAVPNTLARYLLLSRKNISPHIQCLSDHLIPAIEECLQKNLDYDSAVAFLHTAEQNLKVKGTLSAKVKTVIEKKSSDQKPKTLTCNYCGKSGHLEIYCRSKIANSKKESDNSVKAPDYKPSSKKTKQKNDNSNGKQLVQKATKSSEDSDSDDKSRSSEESEGRGIRQIQASWVNSYGDAILQDHRGNSKSNSRSVRSTTIRPRPVLPGDEGFDVSDSDSSLNDYSINDDDSNISDQSSNSTTTDIPVVNAIPFVPSVIIESLPVIPVQVPLLILPSPSEFAEWTEGRKQIFTHLMQAADCLIRDGGLFSIRDSIQDAGYWVEMELRNVTSVFDRHELNPSRLSSSIASSRHSDNVADLTTESEMNEAVVSNAVVEIVDTSVHASDANLNEMSIYPIFSPLNIRPSSMLALSKMFKIHNHTKGEATLDSGAMEHVTPSIDNLEIVTKKFSNNKPPPINLYNASSQVMPIIAMGDLNNRFKGAFVSPDCDGTLIATCKLQADGLGVIHPPHSSGNKIGGIIFRPLQNNPGEADIIAIANERMIFNYLAEDINLRIRIPDFSPFSRNDRRECLRIRVLTVSGIVKANFNVQERVEFAQKTFLCSKSQMLWASEHHPGYPVTSYEVTKYYSRDLAYAMGHSQKSINSNARHHDNSEQRAIDAYIKNHNDKVSIPDNPVIFSSVPLSLLSNDRCIPFHTISGDIVHGPGAFYICTNDDRASGHSMDFNMVASGKVKASKKTLHSCTEKYLDYLASHNMHSKEWSTPVSIYRSDSEAIYKSETQQEIFRQNGIHHVVSSPDHKEQSPAEANIKAKKHMVSVMFHQFPHIPEALWVAYWHLVNLIRNNRQSKVPGHDTVSREFELTGKFMSLAENIFIPGGHPVVYFLSRERRQGEYIRMYPGSYIGPAIGVTPPSIRVFSFATREVITTADFELVKPKLLNATNKMNYKFFTLNKRDMERPYLIDTAPHETRQTTKDRVPPTTHDCMANANIESLFDSPSLPAISSLIPDAVTDFVYTSRHEHSDGLISHVVTSATTDISISALRRSSRVQFRDPPIYDESNHFRLHNLNQAHGIPGAEGNNILLIAPSSIVTSTLGNSIGEGVFAKIALPANTYLCSYVGQRVQYPDKPPHRRDFPLNDALFFIPSTRTLIVGDKLHSFAAKINTHADKSFCNTRFRVVDGSVQVWTRESIIPRHDEIFISYTDFNEFFNDSECDSMDSKEDDDSTANDVSQTSLTTPVGSALNPIFINHVSRKASKQHHRRSTQRKSRRALRQILANASTAFYTFSASEQEDFLLRNRKAMFADIEKRNVGKQRVSTKRKIRIIKQVSNHELEAYVHSMDNPIVEIAMKREDASFFAAAMEKQLVYLKRKIHKAGVKGRHFDSPTLTEAKKRGDWTEWSKAIQEEYDQMINDEVHGPAILGQLPSGANLIGTMWVLKIKRNPSTGEIEKYKARLVALGNQQKDSSFDQIKSITARGSTVKMLIAIQAKTKSSSMVLDVKGAYLKSTISEASDEKLYIRYPDGKKYKLNKYLYGLRQAGFEWQRNVTTCLLKSEYKQSTADPMVFNKRIGEDFIIMSLHVDDFYVISSKQEMLEELYRLLTREYGTVSIKSNDLMSYLGMEVRILANSDILISQPAYVKSILDLYNTGNKKAKTPMRVIETAMEGDLIRVDQIAYLQLVGALNHLSQYTRPDILFAVSSAAQKCSAPNQGNVRAVLRIFQYLANTPDIGIRYVADGSMELVGSVDASHNQYEDGRGHYGYSFSLGRGNGSFDAKSTKLKLNTLSSTESEYVAFCEATREAIWLRKLLNEIGFTQHGPTIIYEDNMSTIQMLNGAYNHKTSKHIKPKYHFSKSAILDGEVHVEHLVTTEMESDVFTKALHFSPHWKFTRKVLNL